MQEKEACEKEIAYLKKYLPEEKWEEGLQRYKQGEPIQYIIGNVNFYGFLFTVNPNVLIPRFETEELVYKTLEYIKKEKINPKAIADIGTGSGCIAITIKKKLPECQVDATDISLSALEMARKNAKENAAMVTFYEGSLLEPLSTLYDVIISNPPYIKEKEEIMDIVHLNEPHLALYAEKEGLYFYEEILKQAKHKIKKHSLIAFEIGETQGEDVKRLALKYLDNITVSIEKDMQGRDRFVFIFHKETE